LKTKIHQGDSLEKAASHPIFVWSKATNRTRIQNPKSQRPKSRKASNPKPVEKPESKIRKAQIQIRENPDPNPMKPNPRPCESL
jgi:hypothetical protein